MPQTSDNYTQQNSLPSSSQTTSESSSPIMLHRISNHSYRLPIDTISVYNRALTVLHNKLLTCFIAELPKHFRSTSPTIATQSNHMFQILNLSRFSNSRDLIYPSPTSIANGTAALVTVPPPSAQTPIFYARGPLSVIVLQFPVCVFSLHHSMHQHITFPINIRYLLTYFALIDICELHAVNRPEKCPSQRNLLRFIVDTLFDIFSTFMIFPQGHFIYMGIPHIDLQKLTTSVQSGPSGYVPLISVTQCIETLICPYPFRNFMRLLFEPKEIHLRNWTSYFNLNRSNHVDIFNFRAKIELIMPSQNDIDVLFPLGTLHSFFSSLANIPHELQILCYDYLFKNLMHRCDFHYDHGDTSFRPASPRPVLIPTSWQLRTQTRSLPLYELTYTILLPRSNTNESFLHSKSKPLSMTTLTVGSPSHIPSLMSMQANHANMTDFVSTVTLNEAYIKISEPQGSDITHCPCGPAQSNELYPFMVPSRYEARTPFTIRTPPYAIHTLTRNRNIPFDVFIIG